MKQIVIYLFLVVIAVSGVIVMKLNEKPSADKAITVSQYYSVMDPFQGIDVPLYLTNDNHVLTQIDAYQSVYLINEDESKKLALTLSRISVDGEEIYLNETYTKYMLEFDLPVLQDDYLMSSAFLEISLLNDTSYLFEIGVFSYMNVDDNVDYMFWTSLEAIKDNDVEIARIKQISVQFDSLVNTIQSVSIGLEQPVNYIINEDTLIIDINYNELLLYGCPIVLTYIDDQTQIISYFSYLKENAILHSSGVLNNVYDVSIS